MEQQGRVNGFQNGAVCKRHSLPVDVRTCLVT